MTWSEAIERAIETQLEGVPARDLARAAEALSDRYRTGRDEAAASRTASASATATLMSPAERLAYLAVRAPATAAAVSAVLRELSARGAPVGPSDGPADGEGSGEPIESLLDLGAGPGVGLWAAHEQFDTLRRATLIERDAASITLGETLAREAGLSDRLTIAWRRADLRDRLDLAPHDLVLLSYSVGELTDPAASALIDAAWHAARLALVIVEPGTPRHFARLLDLRRRLIDAGAHIAAPCPHDRDCPMAAPHDRPQADWCHFAARLTRSRLHRRLKQGALSYEDEKFSYVIARRGPAHPASARIVRRPEFHKGFVRLALCADEGLRVETVTRSSRTAYRAARDSSWGDAW